MFKVGDIVTPKPAYIGSGYCFRSGFICCRYDRSVCARALSTEKGRGAKR